MDVKWFWVLRLHVTDPASPSLSKEAVQDWGPGLCSGQVQPMHVMLFVMRNLNREQQWGMTGMCFHWRELQKKKKKEEEKRRMRRNIEAKLCPEGALTWAKAED